jgi:branched-chain amino acid transport system substrate-binding protein
MRELPGSGRLSLMTVAAALLLLVSGCAPGAAPATTAAPPGTTAAPATTAAPGTTTAQGAEIVIGIAAPITGSLAELGQQMVNAAQYEVDQINTGGGVEIAGVRHPLRLEVADDEGLVVERAVSAVQQLVDQRNVHVVTGLPISSNSLAVMPIFEESGVPFVSPVSKSTEIPKMISEQGLQYTFELSPTNDDLVAAHGEFISENVQPDRALFLLLNTDAARDYGDRAAARWPEMMAGLETETIFVEPDTQDLQAEILAIQQFDPDLVYVLFVGSIVFTWVDQANAAGLGSQMVIFGDSDYAAPDFPQNTCGKTDLQLANAVTVEAPITSKTVPFFQGYEGQFGSPPPYYAVQTADAMVMIFEALQRLEGWTGEVQTDRAALKDALGTISQDDPVEGIRGVQWFTPVEDGRLVEGAAIAITQIRDCEHVLVWPEGEGSSEFVDPRSS